MTTRMDLALSCQTYGIKLSGLVTYNEVPVDGGLMLWAIAGCESTFGRDRLFVRNESAYSPGGRLYANSVMLRALWGKWGVLGASSFGSFQLMFATATELGFYGHPCDLQQDDVGAQWAARLIKDRIIARGASTLSHVLDAYNSGSHRDVIIPADYIRRGCQFYDKGWPKATNGRSA